MDSGQRQELVQWFLPQLEQAWDDELTGQATVLGQRYVQWAGHGIGLQVDCSSNRVLTGTDRLGAHQVARLRSLGWNPPAGEDLPNHWRVFFDREGLLDAALALVDAVEVLQVPLFVPTPAPSPKKPEPAAEQPGRWVVVVPVVRVDGHQVALARDAAVAALGACIVVDYSRLEPASALPVDRFDDVVTGPVPLPAALAVEPGLLVQTGEPSLAARTLGHALQRVRRLLRRGLDVVLVLPPLPFDLRWLYGAVLADSDVVVLALHEQEDGHLSWGTVLDVVRPLADGPVLLGTAVDLEGSVLLALGGLRAVVRQQDDDVRSQTLTELVRRALSDEAPWPSLAVREALLQAGLSPLLSRLAHLPRRLSAPHEVDAALLLLSDVLHVVQEHLEQVQDVGFAALGSVLDLFALLEDAGTRGVAGVGHATPTLAWLAECGADGAESIAAAAAAVGAGVPPTRATRAGGLSDLLDDLDPLPAVRSVVDALAAAHSPLGDRRSDYVSLRPAGGGAVAVYVHRSVLSLALPAALAPQLAVAVPESALQQGSSSTTYLRIPAATAAVHPHVVHMACEHAFAWRQIKPDCLP